jgi:protein-S-isoprenylcysteine O-methyltransferase Ste14
MSPRLAIITLWAAWLFSWLAASLWTNRTQAQPVGASWLGYRAVMLAGSILMFVPAHGYEGRLRLWQIGWYGAWICVALIALGIGFAWWARIHLGRLWSARITRKEDHRVVDTGPYALVRHPIYTGLLFALLATAAAKGTLWGVAGYVLMLVGLHWKARTEERWLLGELPGGAYAEYRARVPMLLPGWPMPRPPPRAGGR